MEDDDLDLSAWAAPPAPSGLADRVIARLAAADEVIAGVLERRRTRRVFWLAGGLAAALAAVAIAAVIVLTRSPEPATAPGTGTLIAIAPRQLALPGAIANLDPGTEVSWQTCGDTIHVQQRGGAATWRVDKPKLFLDVGAAPASLEASNATLRVETRMNLSDVRVISAAALTSATVALVTVNLYEGHARLSSAGQTVVVQPGTTYQVLPGQPPRLDRAVVATNVAGVPASEAPPELTLPLGEKVTIHDPRGAIRIAIDKQCPGDASPMYPNGANALTEAGDYHFSYTCNGVDEHGEVTVLRDLNLDVLRAPADNAVWSDRVHVEGAPVPARAQITIDGVPLATRNNQRWSAEVVPAHRGFLAVRIDGGLDDVHYYIRRAATGDRTTARPAPAQGLPVAEFERVMNELRPALGPCVQRWPNGQDVAVSIDANGRVTELLTTESDPATDACLRKVLRNALFPAAKAGSRHTHHVDPACDFEELQAAGTAAVARGAHAEALRSFDAALRCKYDIHALQLAFMAACRANEVDYARKYWKRMSTDLKGHFLQICLHAHITKEMLDE